MAGKGIVYEAREKTIIRKGNNEMKPNKRMKEAIKLIIGISFIFIGMFVLISFVNNENMNTGVIQEDTSTNLQISSEVEQYEPTVEKYAKEYGVKSYVDVLLGMMMQESGGRGNDPMQASESYCGEVGCIEDPELSIKQGVYYFSQVLENADGDLELAIQSYNFGGGFIDYVQDRTGNYTEEIAIDFSQEMYENADNKSNYTCLREEAEQYDACYGDIYYVQSVMNYRDIIAMN